MKQTKGFLRRYSLLRYLLSLFQFLPISGRGGVPSNVYRFRYAKNVHVVRIAGARADAVGVYIALRHRQYSNQRFMALDTAYLLPALRILLPISYLTSLHQCSEQEFNKYQYSNITLVPIFYLYLTIFMSITHIFFSI